jgi:hypothetical protein
MNGLHQSGQTRMIGRVATLVISYSRADQAQVRAVVNLLQTALSNVEEAIFWDGQLEPGEPWFQQLTTHIDAAPQLFVFWCGHASSSAQVRREFMYALERRKRVIPVLLDDTPLADELAPIHGIDLRGAIQHGRSGPWRIAMKFAVAAILVSTSIGLYMWQSTRTADASRNRSAEARRDPPVTEAPRDTQAAEAARSLEDSRRNNELRRTPPSLIPKPQPTPDNPPMPVARVPMLVSLAAMGVAALGVILGLLRFWQWRRRKFVVRQFARHLSGAAN